MLALVPLNTQATRLQAAILLSFGKLLKRRLLAGALNHDIRRTRSEGVGTFLARIIESESIESLAPSGAFGTLLSCIEIGLTGIVFYLISSSLGWIALLAAWSSFFALLAALYYWKRKRWTAARFALTDELVEKTGGHRTRAVQQLPEGWHEGEDKLHALYQQSARQMDQTQTWMAVGARGWIVSALIVLAPSFVAQGLPPMKLAISIGLILQGFRSFQKLSSGLMNIVSAFVAWSEIQVIFKAARPSLSPAIAFRAGQETDGEHPGRFAVVWAL